MIGSIKGSNFNWLHSIRSRLAVENQGLIKNRSPQEEQLAVQSEELSATSHPLGREPLNKYEMSVSPLPGEDELLGKCPRTHICNGEYDCTSTFTCSLTHSCNDEFNCGKYNGKSAAENFSTNLSQLDAKKRLVPGANFQELNSPEVGLLFKSSRLNISAFSLKR